MIGNIPDVLIQLGEWQGKTDMLVVTLDDFELILRMKFLKTVKAIIVPHLGCLLIMDGKRKEFLFCGSCLKKEKGKDVMLFAHQVAQGLKLVTQLLLPLCWKCKMFSV